MIVNISSSDQSVIRRVAVLLPLPVAGPYDYVVPADLDLAFGDFVRVPLGTRLAVGVVWGEGSGSVALEKMRPVMAKLAVPPLSEAVRRFIDWVAAYTLQPAGAVLKMAMSVPAALSDEGVRRRKRRSVPESICPAPDYCRAGVTLSPLQTEAAALLCSRVKQGGFSVTMLEGVTGSGKTDVYFEALAATLKSGRQVLVLLPEIALTIQWLERFTVRFGTPPAAWHSELTPAIRRDLWRAVATGGVPVVVGARSALFLPFANLGLIIVDEEHEAAFKQEDGVIYQARDMAVVRGSLGGHPVVLASATPSMETLANIAAGRYGHAMLPSRYGGAVMPEVVAVDMRRHPAGKEAFGPSWLAPPLVSAIDSALAAGEQAMLFLNRRGYAPLTVCQKCGHRVCCPNCTAWLVEHRAAGVLRCHHCGHVVKSVPVCPACGATGRFTACGPGVERVAEEATARFPKARIVQMTSDSVGGPTAAAALVQRIANHEVDIVIGTQIMAKGHHFPLMTLVGVVDADLGLSGAELRAAERTYQLLTQVGGRAGRSDRPGRVLLQTYDPTNPVIEALVSGDRDRFLEVESAQRRALGMPPFGRLAAVIVSGGEMAAVAGVAAALGRAAPHVDGVEVLGPAPAPLAFLRGRHRHRLLVKAERGVRLQPLLAAWLAAVSVPRSVLVRVDVDPDSFL